MVLFKQYSPMPLSLYFSLSSPCFDVEAFNDSGSTYVEDGVATLLIGTIISHLSDRLLQYMNGFGSPLTITYTPLCGNFMHWWYVDGIALSSWIHGHPF